MDKHSETASRKAATKPPSKQQKSKPAWALTEKDLEEQKEKEVDDLLESLPPAVTLVPADPEAALDETQWWLAALGPDATSSRREAALAQGHPRRR